MIDQTLSLTRSGVKDWLIQRISAVILALYAVFIVAVLAAHPHLDYVTWHDLFSHWFVRMFTFLAIISLVLHAWIGIWVVLTDYVKCAWGRLFLQTLVILALFTYLAWGFEILWTQHL